MKVYTSRGFDGYWPVGTAAVIVATSADMARGILLAELASRGLPQKDVPEVKELDAEHVGVVILCDGDY